MTNKSMYILGSIEAIIGFSIICITSIIKEVIPKLGFVAYQNAAAGSYDPTKYDLSFGTANFIGIIFIVLGILQIILAIKKSRL